MSITHKDWQFILLPIFIFEVSKMMFNTVEIINETKKLVLNTNFLFNAKNKI